MLGRDRAECRALLAGVDLAGDDLAGEDLAGVDLAGEDLATAVCYGVEGAKDTMEE